MVQTSEEKSSVEIVVELTPDDVYALNLYHAKHSPLAHKKHLCIWIAFIVIFGFSIQHTWSESNDPLFFILALIPWILVAILVALTLVPGAPLNRWLTRWSVRRAIRAGAYKLTLLKHHMILSPGGIRCISDTQDNIIQWKAVEQIAEDSNHLFIYVQSQTAHIIPRRAFPDEASCRKFLEAVRFFHAQVLA